MSSGETFFYFIALIVSLFALNMGLQTGKMPLRIWDIEREKWPILFWALFYLALFVAVGSALTLLSPLLGWGMEST
jgi:hypothetical protein